MRRKNRIFYLVLLIMTLMAFYFFRTEEPKPITPAPAPQTRQEPPVSNAPLAPLSDERAKEVDDLLKANRLAIGACLMSAKKSQGGKTDLTILWDSLGNVQKLYLVPDLGPEPKSCLLDLIRQWKLAPSSDMAPLSVTKRLETRLSAP